MLKIIVTSGAAALLAAASLGFMAQARTPWADTRATAAAAARRNPLQEERNRALVLYFSEQVFNRHNFAVAEAMLAPDYIQHHPGVGDGPEAFITFFKKALAQDPGMHSEVVRSAADGDLVYVHVRQYNGAGKPVMAILDIFRVKGDKLTEHWDILQMIPDSIANSHTMF